MATTAFTNFLPEVMPQVPMCSDLVALNAVRNSAAEFCERTVFWQETQDAFTATSATFPYDLEAPSGARVSQVLAVLVNGVAIQPTTLDVLDTSVPNWRTTDADSPQLYYQVNPYTMGVYPAIKTGSTAQVQLRVALAPSRTATGVEEFIYQLYAEVIAAGALWRLMEMPAQPWSNPTTGAFYRSKFQQGVTDATIDANKTFGRSQLMVSPVRFA